MGRGHRALTVPVFVAAAPLLPVGPAGLAVAGVVAALSCSGRVASPDADQGWLWQLIDRLLPDEQILDDNGPMQHRGITHWWAWPALAYLLALLPLHVTIVAAGRELTLATAPVLAGLAVGWGSHVLGDFLVGAQGHGRGAGVPLGPWWWWVGTGAKCGGWTEHAITVAAVPAALWLAGMHTGVVPSPEFLTALR